MSDADNVRVAVRVRPLVPSEKDRGCQIVIERAPNMPQLTVNRTDTFTFNYVFDYGESQEKVYDECVSELIDKFFAGFNATILAYGQTGSGKTHTMGTVYQGELNENVGIIPRAMHNMFQRMEELKDKFSFVVKCSFMELYQEQLYDLLSTQPREQSVVEIRENRNGIFMPGLTENLVTSARQTTDYLVRGSAGRAVGSTAMNQQSSRSHAIFTVTVEATSNDEMKTLTTSKFHLVDLAGSERSNKTMATGDRFKEGVKINQGLLALGNVISALGSGTSTGFIGYRDSKLTRLLQDSLGGNSVTLMIACVSPADYNAAETISTLRYADRARKIKNKPIVNQDPHAAEINHLKGIIQKLRMEILAGGTAMSSSLTGALSNVALPAPPADSLQNSNVQSSAAIALLKKENLLLQEKCRNLQKELQYTLTDVTEIEMRAHVVETALDKIKLKAVEINECQINELPMEPSAEDITKHNQMLCSIRNIFNDLYSEVQVSSSEIIEYKKKSLKEHNESGDRGERGDSPDRTSNGSVSNEVHELMQEHTDAYTNKQIVFNERLRRINVELNMKEELHQRVEENYTKLRNLDQETLQKFKECEDKIQELELERNDLIEKIQKLAKNNASAKIAEERRKRLQVLEHEIAAMRIENLNKAKMLKVHEKEFSKVKNLHSEIQAMKEARVKLIRTMRSESENFRQWKLTREKELMQLKNKDRKRQDEMIRKEALHVKQRNVLKRKCEEAMAINKRLKDALDRQRVAQSHRHKNGAAKDANISTTSANKIESAITSVDRELEVILSVIDGEFSLDQLMEDRGEINNRISQLEQQKERSNNSEQQFTAEEELNSLKEELEMRNAQITDLQQKVCAVDIESRISSMCEGIQGVAEGRAVTKHLLKSLTDLRREYSSLLLDHKVSVDEHLAMREESEKNASATAKQIRLLELEHEEAIAERENTYEEKIALLLRELHNRLPAAAVAEGSELTPEQEERLKIQKEHLDKMDSMKDELEYYKNLVEKLKEAVEKKKKPAVKKTEEVPIDIDEENDENEDILDVYSDDSSNDPDWTSNQNSRNSRKRSNNSAISSTGIDETFTTAVNATIATTTVPRASGKTSEKSKSKRKPKGCSCRSNCRSKRCGCHSKNEKCSVRCSCPDDCSNGKDLPLGEEKTEDDAASVTNDSLKIKVEMENPEEFKTPPPRPLPAIDEKHELQPLVEANECDIRRPDGTLLTPKMQRLSNITFNTTATKKKFFDS